MATLKQIDANRRNSQQSTGPRTDSGKQASSSNALKSGIYAESEIIFTEKPEDLQTLTAEYHARFQPTTPEARDLVDSLVRNAWLLRRFAAAEATLFNCNRKEDSPTGLFFFNRFAACLDGLNVLQRRINATERNYHRTLKALQTLPPDPQPVATEPTSENLASFPRTTPAPPLVAPPAEDRLQLVAPPVEERQRRADGSFPSDFGAETPSRYPNELEQKPL